MTHPAPADHGPRDPKLRTTRQPCLVGGCTHAWSWDPGVAGFRPVAPEVPMPEPMAVCRCGLPQGVYHEDCDGPTDAYNAAPPQPSWVREATISSVTGYTPYPQSDTHSWGCFAGLAIEYGGYSDMEIVDPYTGRRLWVPVYGDDQDLNPYDALRRAVDAMQHHKFLDGQARPNLDDETPTDTEG